MVVDVVVVLSLSLSGSYHGYLVRCCVCLDVSRVWLDRCCVYVDACRVYGDASRGWEEA